MKSGFARLLALAILFGAIGCKKPVYHGAKNEPDPEIVAEVIEPPADVPAVSPVEDADLSPRDKILAIRGETVGTPFQDLEINGTLLGDGTIASIDDNGVQLQLRAGLTGFTWADLPAHLRELWGHDPDVSGSPPENASPELAATEDPKAPDPRKQARVRDLESRIAKLSENLQNAHKTVEEAQAFHSELVALHEAEDKKAAAMKAARVFARMRSSSCGS